MPALPLHPPSQQDADKSRRNPLPGLLRTPLGLALIEIQGSLHIPEQTDAEAAPQHIGRLEFPLLDSEKAGNSGQEGAWMKQVYLYIGERQRLTGEVQKLEKAVGVMRKRARDDNSRSDEALEIIDTVRWKLYFGSRPEFV